MKAIVLLSFSMFAAISAHATDLPVAKIAQLQARLNQTITLSDREDRPNSGNATYYAYFQNGALVAKGLLNRAQPFCQVSSLEDDYKERQLPTKIIPPIFDESAYSSGRERKAGEPELEFHLSEKIGENFYMIFVKCYNVTADATAADVTKLTGGAITLSLRPLRTNGRTQEQLKNAFAFAGMLFGEGRPPRPGDYANELKYGQEWECESWSHTEVVRGQPHQIEYSGTKESYVRKFSEHSVGATTYVIDFDHPFYAFETFKEGLFARTQTGFGIALYSYRIRGDELRFMNAYSKSHKDISALPDAEGLPDYKAMTYGVCRLKK